MKPKVICHIMSSVDGRLLNDRWTEPFDGTPASDLFQVYAAIGRELYTDAWMFGKNTLRAAFPYNGESTDILWSRILLPCPSVTVTRSGCLSLPIRRPTFTLPLRF